MSLVEKLIQLDGSKKELTQNLQKKYSRLAKAGDMWEINQLFRQTKIVPELFDEELATLYVSSAKGYVSAHDLERIKEWDSKAHNGKPLVFKSLGNDFAKALQEGYFTLIREDRADKKNFKKLEEITGIPVSEETVQKAINQRIKNRIVLGDYYFRGIEEATGIKPIPDEKVVQGLYRGCLRREKIKGQALYFWEYIAKSTKIMPEEKTAQSAFRYLVKQGNTFDLIRFTEFTGIMPKESYIQQAYNVLARNGEFASKYKEMKDLTGIGPKEDIVQTAYAVVVNGAGSIWDFYFKKIKELTGISPPEELVQKAYINCIKKGEFEDFEELHRTFKVEPSDAVKKTLEKYLVSK